MDIDALKALTRGLVEKALQDIQIAREESSGEDHRFETAAYFLTESKEYVDGAWEMLAVDKVRASLALSRWVLEAALNVFWAVANSDETDQRLRELCGEALRNDAVLAESHVAIWPDLAQPLGAKAKKAREMKRELGVDRKLADLGTRMTDLKASGDTAGKLDGLGPRQYALYRLCCSAAHCSLKIWESSSNTLLTPERACFTAAASPYYLVMNAHVLTETGDANELREWWTKAEPMLP